MVTKLPQDLVDQLRRVRSVGVITGAGISAESGIPTYRGQGGIYEDPDEGERTVEALSAPMLQVDPDRTWRAVAALARAAGRAMPNDGHLALARIERTVDRFALLTQNVDGLHRAAGSRNVIDIHGSVFATRCMTCAADGHLDPSLLADLDAAPRCDACGGILRPGAVLFGEMLPPDRLARLAAEFHDHVPDLVLVAGTSAMFHYIAAPIRRARATGKLTVEVNPERTVLSDTVRYFLQGPAGVYLPLIAEALGAASNGDRTSRP